MSPEHGRSVSAKAGRWQGREVVHARAPVEVLSEITLEGLKLNLGAGWDGTDGYIRVDRAGEPDIRLDVKHLPFDDDSFVVVRAFHILEHIDRRDLVPLMNECWRILKTPPVDEASGSTMGPGGVMEIEVPVFPSEAAMADPTHISFFVPSTFDYFNKGGQLDGERMLYGIKPWALTDRVRDSMAVFLRVRLAKLPDDAPMTPEERRALDFRNVTAGVGEEGSGFAPVAETLFYECCGAPRDGGHLGTCDKSVMRSGDLMAQREEQLHATAHDNPDPTNVIKQRDPIVSPSTPIREG